MESMLRKLKVLYVEDDLVHREELADYLSRRVGRLYLAEDGEQGLEKYDTLKPDLIITDLRMPKMNGIELSEAIRKSNKVVPIIVLTAMSDKDSILEAVRVGIFDYVIKPVDVKELMGVIGKAVGMISVIDHEFGQHHFEPEKLNELKSKLTSYIKKETGKGPIDIRFKGSDEGLEMTFVGTLTKYEISLMSNESNVNLVDYNRRVFYNDRSEVIEDIISSTLNTQSLNLMNVQIDVKKDLSTLTFENR